MPVPLSQQNFNAYGASTTPTLVVLNRAGQAATYHPGAMPYDELRGALEKVAARKGHDRVELVLPWVIHRPEPKPPTPSFVSANKSPRVAGPMGGIPAVSGV